MSGTSMACPHVAGLSALVLAASNGTLSAYPQVKNIVLANADTGISSFNGKVANGARLNAFKALQAVVDPASISPPPPYVQPPPSPSPPPTSPPPPPVQLVIVDLNVTGFPYVSPEMDFSQGTFASISQSVAGTCPSEFSARMVSQSFKKNVFRLNNMPGNNNTIEVNDCQMPNGIFDTMSIVLVCDPGMVGCSCYTDDDGCGYAAGDSVSGVPVSSGKEVYSVILPYSSYVFQMI